MKRGTTTRRQFVAGATLGSGLAALALQANAQTTAPGQPRPTVVLHDRRIQIEPALRARLIAEGARFVELEEDPVRQWRSESSALLADPATRLLGVTTWPQLLMVRGLAAESRRHVLQESIERNGEAVTWLIA